MALAGLSVLQERENRRDVGSGREPRHTDSMTATASAAPAGGTGATAGAYDSAAHRDEAIVTINTNKTRIDEIEAVLIDLGILVSP